MDFRISAMNCMETTHLSLRYSAEMARFLVVNSWQISASWKPISSISCSFLRTVRLSEKRLTSSNVQTSKRK